MAVLLDTHAWAWAIDDAPRLSARAVRAIEAADRVHVAAVTFYEIGQKVRLGKWPEMAAYVHRLQDFAAEQDIMVLPLNAEIAQLAGMLDWPHRDPFDRILAATALHHGMELISADTVFDAVPGLRRVW